VRLHEQACLLIAVIAVSLLSGCSDSKMTNTWKDPQFQGPIKFQKTVTLCIHPDPTVRRIVEDEMVKQIGANRAVAGHTILSDDDRKDVNKVKAKLQAAGVDGAVTLRLAGSRTETAYDTAVGGEAPFYDYYDRNGAFMSSQESAYSDNIIAIQTHIYSVTEGRLLWSGTTELTNPSDAREIVDSLAKAVGAELKKEKLL
jgi:hypothetical protein